MNLKQVVWGCLLGVSSLGAAPTAPSAKEIAAIPLADFFKESVFESPSMNGSGDHVAALFTNEKDETGITLINLDEMKATHRLPSNKRSMLEYTWLGDRHLAATLLRDKVLIQAATSFDVSGKEPMVDFSLNHEFGIVSVPAATPLAPLLWFRWTTEDLLISQRVVRINARKEVSSGVTGTPGEIIEMLPEIPKGYGALDYYSDGEGEVRLVLVAKKVPEGKELEIEGEKSYLHRVDGQWIAVPFDPLAYQVVGMGDRPEEVWAYRIKDPSVIPPLVRLTIDDGQEKGVLFQDPKYDPINPHLQRDPATKKIVALTVLRSRVEKIWFDQDLKAFESSLAERLPGQAVTLLNWDRSRNRFLVQAESDRSPPIFYIVDLAKKQMNPVGDSRPWISRAALSPTKAFMFKTRDGQPLQGFLTLPLHASASAPAPLILLPHHGPSHADGIFWDPVVAALSSRGYAVLRVNYRGTGDRLSRFPKEDHFDLGKMADDLNDAVKTVVERPEIDGKRVGAVGWGLGAPLAVLAAAREPQVYRAVVAWDGAYDLDTYFADLALRPKDTKMPHDGPSISRVVSIRGNRLARYPLFEKWKSQNVLEQLGGFKSPVLVLLDSGVFGVQAKQSYSLRSALRKHNVPVRLIENEGHPMDGKRGEATLRLMGEAEKFLAKELAP